MKRWSGVVRCACWCAAALLWAGCDGDDSNRSSVGPDISGGWSGRYYYTDGSVDQSVKASVVVNGGSVFMETNLPDTGRLLTGSMGSDGHLFMTDAHDGETWTTIHGPVSSGHIELLDFAHGAGSSTLRVIELNR
jgi:hypothetical protein